MDFTKDFGFVADVAVGEEAHEAQPARVVGVMAATSSTSLRAASVSWSGLTRASTPWLWAMLRGFEPLFQVIKRGQGGKGSSERNGRVPVYHSVYTPSVLEGMLATALHGTGTESCKERKGLC
jgi:hypothetical protein